MKGKMPKVTQTPKSKSAAARLLITCLNQNESEPRPIGSLYVNSRGQLLLAERAELNPVSLKDALAWFAENGGTQCDFSGNSGKPYLGNAETLCAMAAKALAA